MCFIPLVLSFYLFFDKVPTLALALDLVLLVAKPNPRQQQHLRTTMIMM